MSSPVLVAPIRILLLEDSDIDAELLVSHLERAQLRFELVRARRRQEYVDALAHRGRELDIVLADYSLPDFDGLTALTMVRATRADLPFIFVSGVVGEDFATDALKQGAIDYILKRNLARLPKAVERAMAETGEREKRRRIEAALSETEARLRLAAEIAEIGVWSLDPQTGEMQWDDWMRELAGVTSQAEIHFQRTFLRSIHEEDRERVTAAFDAALDPQGHPRIDLRFRLIGVLNSRERWLAVNGRRFDEAGGKMRMIGTARDITLERRKDEALRQANETLEARIAERTRERDRIWRLSPELMDVLRPDGTFAAVNPAWETLLGWTEQELVDTAFVRLVHPEDAQVTMGEMMRLDAGEPTVRFDNRCRVRDGSYRWIRWTASPDQGYFYAIGRDVTEERARAEELADINRELVRQIRERREVEDTLNQMQRLEAVGQLTSGVAHDFNNLLTVVLTNLSLIERSVAQQRPDPKLPQRLASMRDAAERGAKLTAQLLAFARRQRLEPKPIDLNETVNGMRSLLESTVGGSVRIETELAADLWTALVDPTQIGLVILNLAINARDAMEVGGSLKLRTANIVLGDRGAVGTMIDDTTQSSTRRAEEPGPGEYILLSVSDTGTGMTDEVLARALEPFFTTKEIGKGSGLGLAQVYGFAKQSGGGVSILTTPGKGTSVQVFLPRAPIGRTVAVDRPLEGAPMAPCLTGDCTVLLLDDDSAVRSVTADMLRELGYRVVQAGNGPAALALLRDTPDINMLVADFAMPGMNGVAVARAARQQRPDLPVLFVTGYADLTSLQGVSEEQILQKPFSEPELAYKLRRALAAGERTSDRSIESAT